MADFPTDFRGDLCASRQDAARLAFAAAPTLRRVWTERRYVGKPCGNDIQWIERREVEAEA